MMGLSLRRFWYVMEGALYGKEAFFKLPQKDRHGKKICTAAGT